MNSSVTKTLLSDLTFLVVDNEPDNIGVIAKLLQLLGAHVYVAEDGQQGLEDARRQKPDIILSDLSMPGMSGWEMLYHIKQDPELKQIPVIALTAHAMVGDRQRVLDAGFENYIAKPIDVPKFIPEFVNMLRNIPQTAVRLAE